MKCGNLWSVVTYENVLPTKCGNPVLRKHHKSYLSNPFSFPNSSFVPKDRTFDTSTLKINDFNLCVYKGEKNHIFQEGVDYMTKNRKDGLDGLTGWWFDRGVQDFVSRIKSKKIWGRDGSQLTWNGTSTVLRSQNIGREVPAPDISTWTR